MKIKYKILFSFLFCVLFFSKIRESKAETVIDLETEKSVIDIENESISATDGVLLKYGDISIKSDNLKKLAKKSTQNKKVNNILYFIFIFSTLI